MAAFLGHHISKEYGYGWMEIACTQTALTRSLPNLGMTATGCSIHYVFKFYKFSYI